MILFVGELNPLSADPKFALWPLPVNSAGWRLCHHLLRATEHEYLTRYDRVNLCAAVWSGREASLKAHELESLVPKTNPFVLLGKKVTSVVWPALKFFEVRKRNGRTYLSLPHPSGLCHAWNDPVQLERARLLIGGLEAKDAVV